MGAPISDGEFWELWKRSFIKNYVGPDGNPSLTSKSLIRPYKTKIVTSAGAKWTRLYNARAVIISTPDSRRIDFVPGHHPDPSIALDATRPYNQSITGYAKLYAPGEWHVKTPLIGADVEGGFVTLLVRDAALGIDGANLTPPDLIGAAAGAPPFDLKSINGSLLTPFDWTGQRLKDVVWGANLVINPLAAVNFAILAANPARRALAIFNNSPAGGASIAVTTDDPATAFKGFFLPPPQSGYIWDPPNAVTKQKLNGWATVGGGQLIVTEGT